MQEISKKSLTISVLIAALFVVPILASAQLPVIPEGPDPSSIDSIPGLISYIYNIAFWIVGIAVFFSILWGAFQVFFTAASSSTKLAEAQKRIWNAVVGLILLFASWMILNIINPDLVKNTFDFKELLQGTSNGGNPGDGTNPTPTTTATTTNTNNPTPTGGGGPGPSVSAGSCQPLKPGNSNRCYSSACDQYQGAIQQYARGGVTTVAFMKSIMWIESTCKYNAQSGAGAYGLMQFLVPTAQGVAQRSSVRSRCGIAPGERITSSWLLNQANASKQICLSVEYFNGDIARFCDPLPGSKIRNYGGGYNAGQGRCKIVSQQLSCDSAPQRQYERYREAEQYGRKILYCLNHQ